MSALAGQEEKGIVRTDVTIALWCRETERDNRFFVDEERDSDVYQTTPPLPDIGSQGPIPGSASCAVGFIHSTWDMRQLTGT